MKGRAFVGTVVTGLWLTGCGWLAWQHRADLPAMKLSEWGDYFAGAVAPLAFLWLIIGYLQQGEEVRSNTDTLQRQQQSLERQVQETAALAKHSEEQVRVATERLDLERKQWEQRRASEKARIRPVFTFRDGATTIAGSSDMRFRNSGGMARHITVKGATPPSKAQFWVSPADIDRGGEGVLAVSGLTGFPTTVTVGYIDSEGDEGQMRLECFEQGKFRLAPNQKSDDSSV